jgi:hypothetical protein
MRTTIGSEIGGRKLSSRFSGPSFLPLDIGITASSSKLVATPSIVDEKKFGASRHTSHEAL